MLSVGQPDHPVARRGPVEVKCAVKRQHIVGVQVVGAKTVNHLVHLVDGAFPAEVPEIHAKIKLVSECRKGYSYTYPGAEVGYLLQSRDVPFGGADAIPVGIVVPQGL